MEFLEKRILFENLNNLPKKITFALNEKPTEENHVRTLCTTQTAGGVLHFERREALGGDAASVG